MRSSANHRERAVLAAPPLKRQPTECPGYRRRAEVRKLWKLCESSHRGKLYFRGFRVTRVSCGDFCVLRRKSCCRRSSHQRRRLGYAIATATVAYAVIVTGDVARHCHHRGRPPPPATSSRAVASPAPAAFPRRPASLSSIPPHTCPTVFRRRFRSERRRRTARCRRDGYFRTSLGLPSAAASHERHTTKAAPRRLTRGAAQRQKRRWLAAMIARATLPRRGPQRRPTILCPFKISIMPVGRLPRRSGTAPVVRAVHKGAGVRRGVMNECLILFYGVICVFILHCSR